MAENIKKPSPVVVDMDDVEKTPNRFVSFINKHPRFTKVAAATGTVITVVAGALLVKNVSDRKNLNAAVDDLDEAMDTFDQTLSEESA